MTNGHFGNLFLNQKCLINSELSKLVSNTFKIKSYVFKLSKLIKYMIFKYFNYYLEMD